MPSPRAACPCPSLYSVHTTTTHLKRLDGPFSTSLKMKAYKPTRLRCQSPIDAEKIESPKAKHQKK